MSVKDFIPKNWKELTAWLIVCLASAFAGYLGYPVITPPPPPLPVWQSSFGWIDDPAAVADVSRTLTFRTFSDTPAGQSLDPLPKQVFLWDAYRKLFNTTPPTKNQGQVGSCVSFGTNNAIARTIAVQIAIGKANYEFKDIAEEVTYAGSRVEVGGGRIRGDGSVGAWAAQFVQQWGIVSREVHDKHDLTSYSEARARSWGQSGVPAELESLAKEHPVKDITQVKTWDAAKLALSQGYGIAVCSGQGFSMQRDSRGVAKASGSWAHCMCLDGYVVDADGREYGHIENSWGADSHKGPVGWGGPSTAGFWAESTTIAHMLAQDDSWAFSTVQGFPAQKINWFVHLRSQKNERLIVLEIPVPHHLRRHGLHPFDVSQRSEFVGRRADAERIGSVPSRQGQSQSDREFFATCNAA